MDNQVKKISEDYFDYMARNYPVMCLSDEFYFFPRVRRADRFLNILDSLDEQKIRQNVSYIKNLKCLLERVDLKHIDFETQVDITLLNQSMIAFLIEFDRIKIWQIDPGLYLKILLLGIDQILTRFSLIRANIDDYLLDRIIQAPRLLDEARANLRKIPQVYLEVAIEMIDTSIDYFKSANLHIKNKVSIREMLLSLTNFRTFLMKKSSPHISFLKDKCLVEEILKNVFSYKRDLAEVFEISVKEYHQTLGQLAEIAIKVEPGKSWQQILSKKRIEVKDANELLGIYSDEIKRLQDFIEKKDIITIQKTQEIQVRFTPRFMQPLRATASYSSPITDDVREPGFFYITADLSKTNNFHNEYIFMTAHETYPGHHLLDSIRRRISNPIRQQIESPFFYEGWASYAERLIDKLGYINDPFQRMVGLKRQAWRAVRAMLDVGIRINRLKSEDGMRLLKDLGYDARIAKSMFRHYVLLPGYQLCYTIGKFEIDKLQKKFSSRFGLKRFHEFLLDGGQIPFDLIEKRMRNQLCKKNF